MPRCALCMKEADILYTCLRCGRPFSPGCGDIGEQMCYECLAEEW